MSGNPETKIAIFEALLAAEADPVVRSFVNGLRGLRCSVSKLARFGACSVAPGRGVV